jgi:hypothetical protein
MAKDVEVIWAKRQRKYFLKEDWTTQIRLNCFAKLRFTLIRFPTLPGAASEASRRKSDLPDLPDTGKTMDASHAFPHVPARVALRPCWTMRRYGS